ncbi:iron chelate uptake ABC transporter family permease subunit [Streptomyces griseus]
MTTPVRPVRAAAAAFSSRSASLVPASAVASSSRATPGSTRASRSRARCWARAAGRAWPPALACGPALRRLELGDDTAAALGTRTERVRLVLVVLGVALIALVTAAAGPIAFIALAAPQIARRITRSASVALLPSAVLGGFLLALADLAGQRLFAPVQLPVGIVTVSIGGLYLVWLLVREARRT